MIDRDIKQCLGQMMKGVQVIGAAHGGVQRAYTSHWLSQVSFEEPIVMASVSPKHDTYPLMIESGQFAASLLAADQIVEGQYFSYPGRRFEYVAPEYLKSGQASPVARQSFRTRSHGSGARRSSKSQWKITSCCLHASSRCRPAV